MSIHPLSHGPRQWGRIKDLLANEVPSINDYGLVVYTYFKRIGDSQKINRSRWIDGMEVISMFRLLADAAFPPKQNAQTPPLLSFVFGKVCNSANQITSLLKEEKPR